MAADFRTLNFAWQNIVLEFSPFSSGERNVDIEFSIKSLNESITVLHQHGLSDIIGDWFLQSLQQDLSQNINKSLWKCFNTKCTEEAEAFDLFFNAITDLYHRLSLYFPIIDKLEHLELEQDKLVKSSTKSFLLFKAILFQRTPKTFQDVVYKFYSMAFRVHHVQTKDLDEEDDDKVDTCRGCCEKKKLCKCQEVVDKFNQINKYLRELGLLDRLSSDPVTSLIHQRIKLHIEHTCQGNFEVSYLEALQQWLEDTVLKWLLLVYSNGDLNVDLVTSTPSTSTCVTAYRERLQYYLHETYANVRIGELFNIIIEFPESEPAMLDLKSCLDKTDLRTCTIQSLRHALETRLLHPGVNTADILTAYISAIRALRVLDPSGVILELVCEPVRKYLRSRDDTVRCIVSSLTEGDGSELASELIKGQQLIIDENYQSDDDDENWEQWMPDPVDADPNKTSKSRRSSDIISMLVNIYGSKELFVKEYRNLLADRILTQFSYEYEREIRYLELLKLRFGETELHDCEVMLKDVADSKRINASIQDEKKNNEVEVDSEEMSVNAMILSAQFWPQFREEKIKLPETMQESLATYTKGFETLKGNRTLNWKPHLGLMDLEIELKGRTLNYSVSPVHAAIIMQFQDKAKWSIEELGSELQMPVSALRRKITFWLGKGLLKEESPDTFLLVEDHKVKGQQEVMVVDEEEAESAMASSHDQREEELQVFWQYIVGMLTNLDCLPLERIHSILKMFATQGPTTQECSLEELKAFLDKKVKDQQLVYTAGVYRLPK